MYYKLFHHTQNYLGFCQRPVALPGLPILVFAVVILLYSSSLFAVSSTAQQDIVLMLDNAAGVAKDDPQFRTKAAAGEFMTNLPEQTRIAVIVYDANVQLALPFTEVSAATQDTLLSSLDHFDYSGQSTNSAAAMERAIYELQNNARPPAGKTIIFFSHGIINTGDSAQDLEFSKWLRNILADEAAQANIRILGIAFTDTADTVSIQTLTYKTGGNYYRAFNANDIQSAFQKITASLESSALASSATQPSEIPQEAITESQTETSVPAASDSGQSAAPDITQPEEKRSSLTMTEQPAAGDTEQSNLLPMIADGEFIGKDEIIRWIRKNISLLITIGGLLAAGALIILMWALWPKRKRRAFNAIDRNSPHIYTPPGLLEDVSGVTNHQSYDITGKLTWISRAPGENSATTRTLVISDDLISRDHAVIQYKDHGYWISDRNSVNGTFLNNNRLKSEKLLKQGDSIRFAKYEFRFILPQREDLAATRVVNTVATNAQQAWPDLESKTDVAASTMHTSEIIHRNDTEEIFAHELHADRKENAVISTDPIQSRTPSVQQYPDSGENPEDSHDQDKTTLRPVK